MRFFSVVFILCFSLALNADVLYLTNGDTIQGKKLRDEEKVMVWESPVMGELRIPKTSVKQINRTVLNVTLTETPVPADTISSLTSHKLQSVQTASATKTSADVDNSQRFALTDINIDFSGKDSRGNDNKTSYSIDFDSKFRHLRHRHYVDVDHDVEENEGKRTTDKQLLGYKYNYVIDGPWLGYMSATREKDKLNDLRERLKGSAGPGYEMYDTNTLRLAFETGLAYTREDFREDEDRQSWGWHYGMDWRWLMDETGVEIFHNHSFLQSFDVNDDWDIETETGLRFRLIGNLKAIFKLEYDYDNLPAEDKDKFDRIWSVGASYGW
jgi:putative salt-induced outer membrane protein YdiY